MYAASYFSISLQISIMKSLTSIHLPRLIGKHIIHCISMQASMRKFKQVKKAGPFMVSGV